MQSCTKPLIIYQTQTLQCCLGIFIILGIDSASILQYAPLHLIPLWRHRMETFSALLPPRVGKPSGRLIPLTTHKGTITQTFDVSLSLVWTNRWINTVLTQWIRNVDSWDATVMKCYQVVIPPIVRLRDSIMRSRNLIPPNGTWSVALYLYPQNFGITEIHFLFNRHLYLKIIPNNQL